MFMCFTASIEELELTPGSFDIVAFFDVSSHVRSQGDSLRQSLACLNHME